MGETLQLRRPELADEAKFLRAYESTKKTDANFAHYFRAGLSYGQWMEILEKKRAGIEVESGTGPSTYLLAWVAGEIVGRLALRHSLKESLLRERGHIGFVVLPEQRRKGYATEMLRLALPIAREVGLTRVLLTCDQGNTGSQKAIEKCGGVFSGVHEMGGNEVPRLQFWIEL